MATQTASERIVDMSGARRVVPESIYELAAVGCSDGRAKDSGNHYWRFTFCIQTGPYAGFKLNKIINTVSTAVFTLADYCAALGIVIPETPEEAKNFRFSPVEQFGKRFYGELVKVQIKPNDGGTPYDAMDIKRFIPKDQADSVRPNAFDDDQPANRPGRGRGRGGSVTASADEVEKDSTEE